MVKDNRAKVRKVLEITLLLNLFVMMLKAVVGYWTGSLSLLADALHSVTDSANNVLGLVTSQFSSPKPDRDHPYGHQKFEAVGALGIAAFLGIACFEILQGAIERIFQGGEPVNISPSELWILLIVLGVNIFVAFYERHVGQEVGSPILIADAKHTMSDVWVTITVLLGLIGVWQGRVLNVPQLELLDVFLAFPVALLVFWSGWSVLKENLPWLLDEMAIAPEAIHAIALSVPGAINCHDIASRGVLGRQVFIEMHMIVDAKDVESAHRITEEVEARIEEKFGPARILIHVEPPDYQAETISFESDSIRAIALSVPGAIDCYDIASRGLLGHQIFIEMHMIVDAKDEKTARRIAEEVEARIEEQFSPVRILIHVELPTHQSETLSFKSERANSKFFK